MISGVIFVVGCSSCILNRTSPLLVRFNLRDKFKCTWLLGESETYDAIKCLGECSYLFILLKHCSGSYSSILHQPTKCLEPQEANNNIVSIPVKAQIPRNIL